MDAVWPLVATVHPGVSVTIAGRNPDPKLVRQARDRGLDWIFTGSVDDIRPFVYEAAVYIIPLRVGGGTRIKAYEAMALGRPVVSTTLGAEGLELEPRKHYLAADTAEGFAASVIKLLADTPMRVRLATDARKFVEQRFSAGEVAKSFEAICRNTIEYVKRNKG
jgi:polysaccharide biosynthesis protein PslH